MKLNPEQVVGFADFHEQYTSKYIALADGKATLIVAFSGGLLGYLASSDAFAASLEFSNLALSLSFGASLVLLAASFFFAFLAICPSRRRSGKDVVFWRAVAAFPSARDYIHALDELDHDRLAEHRLVHCYDLSCVCATKYDRLSLSLRFGVAGIAAAVFALASFKLSY